MPLLSESETTGRVSYSPPAPVRRQSQHSVIAKSAIMSNLHSIPNVDVTTPRGSDFPAVVAGNGSSPPQRPHREHREEPEAGLLSMTPVPTNGVSRDGTGAALSDTPFPSAPTSQTNSPKIPPMRSNSGSNTPRIRATTLDIPGLTKSKASPDGRIASRDIGAKLVIVMVGLPARGKSYITKKVARYLNWLQHDTRIFNVGERRREAGRGPSSSKGVSVSRSRARGSTSQSNNATSQRRATIPAGRLKPLPGSSVQLPIHTRNEPEQRIPEFEALPPPANPRGSWNGTQPSQASNLNTPSPATSAESSETESMDQSASFFDPSNTRASLIRERAAQSTLDDLLDYVLDQGGTVGMLDATNSTLERRKMIMDRVRARAGPELGVLFLESQCIDESLLESNMRLKLSGPDYKDRDPVTALEDFKERVKIYEKSYVPLGDYEEKNNLQYIQMIDVGRKIISHQIQGFLAAQTVYYLVNFNLSPRQIWITRHGESQDNVCGKIGGNSSLSQNGQKYARALTRFVAYKRQEWEIRRREKAASTHFPPRPGDTTPPNPEYTPSAPSSGEANGSSDNDDERKSFCVWTSMLQRSIQTAAYFDEEEYEVKQMRMLDELNAGDMEGHTYEQIRYKFPLEYELRRRNKLHYRYPGSGGEGYLDVINRLRAVIVEIERMTDHVLLVGHRSVARVLLAYFKGLNREDVADLDVPLGILYMLEPKPYGVEFQAFKYDPADDWFHHLPDYEMHRAPYQTL